MEIKGRTVIITGAGGTIGRALAVEFGLNGAKVVCCGRNKDKLDETMKLIEKENGTGLAITTDITKRSEVQQMIKTSLERFGSIDFLFNNAASFNSIAGIFEVDPKIWWDDVTTNLYGSLLLIREVLPHMISRNEGIIINMNGGRPVGGSGYASSKAGLMELTRILVEELKIMKSSVMVFSAVPGLVRSEATERQANTPAGQKWIPSTKETFESGKTRKPEEIAKATIQMIKIATPKLSGESFGPDTDFSKLKKQC